MLIEFFLESSITAPTAGLWFYRFQRSAKSRSDSRRTAISDRNFWWRTAFARYVYLYFYVPFPRKLVKIESEI